MNQKIIVQNYFLTFKNYNYIEVHIKIYTSVNVINLLY